MEDSPLGKASWNGKSNHGMNFGSQVVVSSSLQVLTS